MNEPFPEGFSVDGVDWLPSGARSGLVRVRGHRPPAISGPLPELILEAGGETRRFTSLPDPRADRDPTAWRGAYVLEAKPAAEADRLWLEWPGGRRIPLEGLNVPAGQVERSEDGPPSSGEVVVDRAVLAERRARRAEASEQAQAKIAREALKAVEVLELRATELEQRALAAEGEREALRGQAADPDDRVESLNDEVRALRAQLAAPISEGDAERRAERLRTALTATVATVADLRLQLHEVDVARRTRDVAVAADLVRLAVVEREKSALAGALETARAQLRRALSARDEAVAELEGVRAAHDDLRGRFSEQSAELGAARERLAELEAEVASVTAVASRSAEEAADAVRDELRTEHRAEVDALRTRLARSEAAITGAETARELAEATALATSLRRAAAEVAAAASPSVSPSRGNVPDKATRSAGEPPAPRASEALIAAAREQERAAAAEREPREEVVADLESAAQRLKAVPEPEPEPEPKRGPLTIVSAEGEPPADLARGRSNRDYPPLRGALVKLAHDDPAAAGRILAGLLKAQHAVLDEPPDYDITIAEVGSFAVSPAGATTLVSPIDAPRGRGQAAFHISGDTLTLLESLAGVEAKPRRRRGPLRATGRVRQARKLTEGVRDASLAELVEAGADLDPLLVLRGLQYAVRPAWTQGQQWAVEIHVDDAPVTVVARHTGGLGVTEGPHDAEPDARVRLSAQAFRTLVAGDAPVPPAEGDARVVQRLLSLAERARSGAE